MRVSVRLLQVVGTSQGPFWRGPAWCPVAGQRGEVTAPIGGSRLVANMAAQRAPRLQVDELLCRRATVADRQDILEMYPNIYEGEDYLPARYYQLMADPNTTCFIALKHGKPVSFCYRSLVDGGQTLYQGGARVAPDCHGDGVMKQLSHYCDEQTLRGRQVRRLTWSMLHQLSAVRLLVDSPTCRLLTMRERVGFTFQPGDLGRIVNSRHFSRLRDRLNMYDSSFYHGHEATDRLTHSPAHQFTPDGHWIVDWQPYRPLVDNYDAIFNRSSLVMTRDVTSLNWARQSEAIAGENNIESLPYPVRAVTFVTEVKIPIGLAVWVDFHPHHACFDPQLMVSTILEQFQTLSRSQEAGIVKYSISYPLNFFPASIAIELLNDAFGVHGAKQKKLIVISKELCRSQL